MVGVIGKVEMWFEIGVAMCTITITLISFLFFFDIFKFFNVNQIVFRVIILNNHGPKPYGLVLYI